MSTNEIEVQPGVPDESQKATFVDHFVALTDVVQQLESEEIVRPIVVAGHQAFQQDENHLTAFFETGAVAAQAELDHPTPQPDRVVSALSIYLKEHGPNQPRFRRVGSYIAKLFKK